MISTFVMNYKKYPPSEIEGVSQKVERRITDICDRSLYKFTSTTLADSSAAYVDYKQLTKFLSLGWPVKHEYIAKVVANLSFTLKETIKQLDEMYKQDQVLKSYYDKWRVSFKQIEPELIEFLIYNSVDLKLYSEELKRLKQ